ncbi:MAG: Guanine nucleotide exchange factor lte1, partial [Watsoniomyces obsoletus]
MDDFMPDRKLRARFCSEINRMYHDVEARRTRGTSDLKVLRDLKRCWNGRCSMYWDPTDFSLDGDQDDDLQPGGLDDLELIHKPEIVEELP